MRELPTTRLDVVDIPEPHVERGGDVVVEVEACGICGTDLHILAGEAYRPELPFVLGHEPVGRVVDAGQAAGDWVGRRVTATPFEGCGACACCAAGDTRICPLLRSILGVLERNGAFADRFVVAADQLVAVPDSLTGDQAAALVDAGATAMNAARVVLARERRRTAIVGGGPVGMLVAELLADAGSSAVVAEPNTARRRAFAARGYAVAESLDEVTGALDCVVECSGSPLAPAWALNRVDPRGLLVLAGYAVVPEIDFAPVARKELTVRGVRSGSRADLAEILALAGSRRISLPPVHAWPLDDIDEALSALRRGALDGKAVIHPN
jgi:alcohol dehydrogenase, propanol-preferring